MHLEGLDHFLDRGVLVVTFLAISAPIRAREHGRRGHEAVRLRGLGQRAGGGWIPAVRIGYASTFGGKFFGPRICIVF